MQKFKRLLAGVITFITLLAVTPVAAHAEWRQGNNGWWYSQGGSYATGWTQIGDKWYHFDSDGYMQKDCYVDGYYLTDSGKWIDLKKSITNGEYNNKYVEFIGRLHDIETKDSGASQNASTTYDICEYANNYNQQYDNLLNDIFNYLKENIPQGNFGEFQADEIQWNDEKQTAMKNYLSSVKGGSMSSYIIPITSLRYNHDRIYALLTYMSQYN